MTSTDVRVELHDGPREELRSSFKLAEDSETELASYIDKGRVLVARRGDDIVGHLQLIETDEPGVVELNSMAVREDMQRRGIGALLVRAVCELAGESAARMTVSTAAESTGNLRFYQRQGFRMLAIERDAFTAPTGYPAGIEIDGIPMRDRVWRDRPLGD